MFVVRLLYCSHLNMGVTIVYLTISLIILQILISITNLELFLKSC